jgi:GTP-binding protein
MKIKTSEFVISNTDPSKCPAPNMPEYAFIGRSNVGKSSLINMLTDRKKLAKISGRPGKTQLINHFIINEQWYLVDLPGYGFAKASKKDIKKWEQFIHSYLRNRENLMCVFVLIDSRHSPQKNDLEFMQWLGYNELPFVMCFTKLDKLGKGKQGQNVADYKKEMLKVWDELPPIFITSAEEKTGQKEVLQFIEETNLLF